MKMEDHFKDTLRKAVANEPPVIDAWTAFQARTRTGRRVQLFAALAAAAVIVTAVAIIVPKLGGDGVRPFPPSTQGPSVDPYEGWQSFVQGPPDAEKTFSLRYPPTWSVGWYEGSTEIRPAGLPGLPQGEPTFAVEIQPRHGELIGQEDGFQSATTEARPDGRRYVRVESTTGGQHVVTYRIEWGPEYGCFADVTANGYQVQRLTLRVAIIASTQALDAAHAFDGEKIVDSIAYVPSDSPSEGAHGLVAPGVPINGPAEALLAYLDARVEGVGADSWVSTGVANAMSQAERDEKFQHDGPWAAYRVISATALGDGTARYVVQLHASPATASTCLTATEEIHFGPGRSAVGTLQQGVVLDWTKTDGALIGLYRFYFD